MKSLVIYDSVFGNTEKIAFAIGKSLGSDGDVDIISIGEAVLGSIHEIDLLVVGSPTREFRPTEPITELIKSLPKEGLRGVRVAAFDTRILLDTIESSALRFMVDKGGYAANKIARALTKKGGELTGEPGGFLVTGTEGPLADGELERAGEWAQGLVLQYRQPVAAE